MKSNVIEMRNQWHQMAADINSKTPMNIMRAFVTDPGRMQGLSGRNGNNRTIATL